MSEVFREVTFTFDGTEFTLVPSIALLRRIKGQGINCMLLAQACLNGGADPLDLVTALRAFVVASGSKAPDEDDAYQWLTNGNTNEIISFQTAFVSAVLPSIDLGKKLDAPAAPTTKTRSTRSKT